MDLFMVLRLDVAAGQETVDAIPEPEVIAVFELTVRDRNLIDGSTIGALEIGNSETIALRLEAGMVAGHRRVIDTDVALEVASQQNRAVAQYKTTAQAQAWGVDLDEIGPSICRSRSS